MAIPERTLGCALFLVLGACAGTAGTAARRTDVDVHRILVRIEFEPALTAPGELDVAHECGERLTVATARSGVELRLRPGPVALTLRAGGQLHVCALRITKDMPPFPWRLGD